jgi:flagellin-like hook-associated protein FlgL
MSSGITLTSAVRSNLLALQTISGQESTTQQALATGKKVNSALDNPIDYFTAASLSARSGELSQLLDSMTNGVNTLQAASNGLTSITSTLQSMEATVTQARQDASWQSTSYTLNTTAIGTTNLASIGFSGGAVGSTAVNITLNGTQTSVSATSTATAATAGTLTISGADINNGATVNVGITSGEALSNVVAAINTAVGDTTNSFATFSATTGKITLKDDGPNTISLTDSTSGTVLTGIGFSTQSPSGTVTSTQGASTGSAVSTVDQLVRAINSNSKLSGNIKATDNAGQLEIENLSTSTLSVTGAGNGNVDGASVDTIGANTTRQGYVTQFNQLKDQLDKTAADSSYNGINLLNGDQLKLYFNESSTSSLVIQSTNPDGVNSSTLGLTDATDAQFQSNTQLNSLLLSLQSALGQVSSQASNFGSNLSIVQNRQDFTNNMVNTLQTGAEDLTIADTNEEGANMLALQTRQQLSIEALSLASQDQQSVLKLFG